MFLLWQKIGIVLIFLVLTDFVFYIFRQLNKVVLCQIPEKVAFSQLVIVVILIDSYRRCDRER